MFRPVARDLADTIYSSYSRDLGVSFTVRSLVAWKERRKGKEMLGGRLRAKRGKGELGMRCCDARGVGVWGVVVFKRNFIGWEGLWGWGEKINIL